MRPLIAVVGRPIRPGRIRGWPPVEAVGVPRTYVDGLRRAGAREAILYPDLWEPDGLLDRFDGLMLIGGGDVQPAHYGGGEREEMYGFHKGRDALELDLCRRVVDGGLPTLAICRGLQVLNVAFGGTLDPHLPDRDGHVVHTTLEEDHVLHDVRIEPGSRIAGAMGVRRATVASTHHQGVEKLGEGLIATSWAEDDVIEAAEHEDGWVVAVQWHPERTADRDPAQQGLFDALARSAGA